MRKKIKKEKKQEIIIMEKEIKHMNFITMIMKVKKIVAQVMKVEIMPKNSKKQKIK